MMWLALSVQLAAVILLSGGIYIEIRRKAHLGFILITVGSFLAFLSEKIRG